MMAEVGEVAERLGRRKVVSAVDVARGWMR